MDTLARGRKAGQITDAFSIPYILTKHLLQEEGKASRKVGEEALLEWGEMCIRDRCVGCQPCSITTGFAGAGAFSDGKLSLSPDVGGTLPEILGYEKATELINEADSIYLKFGADEKVYLSLIHIYCR